MPSQAAGAVVPSPSSASGASPSGRAGTLDARDPFELTELPAPSSPSRTHQVTFEAREAVLDLGQGLRYRARTYQGQVPAPVVHVREGDRVHLVLENHAPRSSPVPAAGPAASPPRREAAASVAQQAREWAQRESIAIHGSGLGDARSFEAIGPGQRKELDFVAASPGVFMIHSMSPMVLERVADGQHGALVVEPRDGWPTRADRAYLLVQSELYARQPAAGTTGGPRVARLDPVAVRSGVVSYMLHNGRIHGPAAHPFRARPGQRVRLFVLNAGPNHAAALSIEGLLFDRVYAGGNPANLQRGLAVLDLPPGAGAVAEVVVPASGWFVVTDHSLHLAAEGATSQLAAVQGQESVREQDVARASAAGRDRLPPELAVDAPGEGHLQGPLGALRPDDLPPLGAVGARSGFAVFARRCALCHSERASTRVGWEGPLLGDVARRLPRAQLLAWLERPAELVQRDPQARRLRARYGYTMPAQPTLATREKEDLLAYLAWLAERTPASSGARP